MKTTTNMLKSLRGTFFALLLLLVLGACKEDGKGMIYPEPPENPIMLTAKEQSKVIEVKNLASIRMENPKTDTYEFGDQVAVGNDWIKITLSGLEMLIIDVEENTSNTSRTYNLPMLGKPGTTILRITQLGK